MSVSNPLVSISRKLVKLWRVWRERNTIGLLKFLYRRSVEKFRRRANYEKWVESERLTRADLLAAQRAIEGWAYKPTFSVIMPVYNVEAVWLEKAIRSVQNQIYPHWELCIADDASPKPHIKQILTRYSKVDPRIKVVFRSENGQIVAASNDALALATGDYIALLDHDD
ncbi:MAG TPA: glycosyltransferase, partial [Crinalium sp.]